MSEYLKQDYFIVVFNMVSLIIISLYYLMQGVQTSSWMNESSKRNNDSNATAEQKKSVYLTIKRVFMLLFILSLGVLAFFYQIAFLRYLYWVLFTLSSILIIVIALPQVVKYTFIKPFVYEITEDFEQALHPLGVALMTILLIISFSSETIIDQVNSIIDQVNSILARFNHVLAEFTLIVILVLWYLSLLFLSSTFLILALNKISIFTKRRASLKETREKIPRKKWKIRYPPLSDIVASRIEMQRNRTTLNKVALHSVWFLTVLIDLLPTCMAFILDYARIVIYETCKLIANAVTKCIRGSVRVVEQSKGKAIAIASRISLLGSLLTVYFIDSYFQILSESGSRVFEFICSVIIIPLVITHLIEIRKVNTS